MVSTGVAGILQLFGQFSDNGAASISIHSGSQTPEQYIEQLASEHRIYNSSHGSGGIYFSIAGSERMRINSSGNMSIGTSTSDALLYARRTSGTTAPIGRFEAAIGAFTGTSLTAQNTLGTSNTYNLFTCVTDSDGDSGGTLHSFPSKRRW
jgi:cellobiose phosphorylase